MAGVAALAALAALTALGTLTATYAHASLPPTDRSAERHCPDSLDAAVAAGRKGELDEAHDALVKLSAECTAWPQVEHALGVIAMRRGDDAEAIARFERAIELDERTAATVGALREVHRWRAARAWRDALGEPGGRRRAPRLDFIDSGTGTAANLREAGRDALLRDADVVAYELYEWWQALRHGDAADLRAWYADGTAPLSADGAGGADAARGAGTDAGELRGLPEWKRVALDVDFTADDAVAVLRWTVGDVDAGRLLLMRTAGDRWVIYRERPL